MLSVTKRTKNGFTLIELMVVVSIIGILATLLTTSFLLARKQGRDARRRSDLQQYRVALENYYSVNSAYPIANTGNDSTSQNGVFSNAGALYIFLNNSIILDPVNDATYKYIYFGVGGTTYKIYGTMESSNYWIICSNGKSGLYVSAVAPTADANCDLP